MNLIMSLLEPKNTLETSQKRFDNKIFDSLNCSTTC